jgi:lipid-binding SYLF domain-containing protein
MNPGNGRQQMNNIRAIIVATALAAAGVVAASPFDRANAASTDLNRDSDQALQTLYRTSPAAAALSQKASAILIFPNVVKAGLFFGGAFGEGELVQGSKVDSYYNSVTASWGLQAGAQSYGYAVFLMNRKAVSYVHSTHGWEIGVGPKNLSTSTLKKDAYAFIFDQKGLMAGVSIEGTKISRIHP